MTQFPNEYSLWCDIETTGLDPTEDVILEVGVVLANDRLEYVEGISSVIVPAAWDYVRGDLSDFILDMHLKSGLIEEVQSHSDTSHREELAVGPVEAKICAAINDWRGEYKITAPMPMWGSSLRLDRNFLESQMPTLHSMFHYRSVDVSTLKEAARVFNPLLVTAWENKVGDKHTHRVAQCLPASMAEMAYYRDNFLKVY